MEIIVAGLGTVGTTICENLIKQGHNLVAVDKNEDVLSELSNTLDIITVIGSCGDIDALKRAGAEKADLFIAVTEGDEMNLLSCAAAKLLGTKHTIARVRNPEYAQTASFMKNELGLSLSINPELAAAKEIWRMLRFPSAAKIETFSRGRVELAEFTLTDDSPLCKKSLFEIKNELKLNFLVCGVVRDGEVFIPSGHFVLEGGDTVNVTVSESDVTKFFKSAEIYKKSLKNVMIIGGGKLTYYLTNLLKKTLDVKIIETDRERCEQLSARFPHADIIHGDGLNPELLDEEGIDSVDAFVALTDIDEENAVNSMYAASKDVEKVITKINKMAYIEFYRSAGIESIVSPKYITAAQILRFVRSIQNDSDSKIERLYKIMDNRAEALEFLIEEDSEVTNIPLKDLKITKNTLIACIVRGEKVITPGGMDEIKKGDTVIVVTTNERLNNIGDILR